jgi:hypothetical protein
MAKTKIAIPNLIEFRDKMDLSGAAFDSTSMNGFIASVDGAQDNLGELFQVIGPTVGKMQDMGLSVASQEALLHHWIDTLDGSSEAIASTASTAGQLDIIDA